MCTVSFVKTADCIIITSNRDEKIIRPSAIPPQSYSVNNQNLIFPKDPKAGGTWFATNDAGVVLVLLNGAQEKHEVQLPYRKSRGLIVLDVISSSSPRECWDTIDLDQIEPFTLVLFQEEQLWQLRWNGSEKETIQLDINQPHVWSSSTLYPAAVREERAKWFHQYMNEKQQVSANDMYQFHRYTHNDNQENGLVINRNDEMQTLSITQAVLQQKKVNVLHYDLITQEDFATSFITI